MRRLSVRARPQALDKTLGVLRSSQTLQTVNLPAERPSQVQILPPPPKYDNFGFVKSFDRRPKRPPIDLVRNSLNRSARLGGPRGWPKGGAKSCAIFKNSGKFDMWISSMLY